MSSLPTCLESSLLFLAPELIDDICHQLDLNTLKQLRLTCKYFADLLTRSVLRSLTIQVTKSSIEEGLSKLITLSTGSHATRAATKQLRIASLSGAYDMGREVTWKWDADKQGWVADVPPEHPLEAVAEETIATHLFNAVSSMKAVEEVVWKPECKDSEQTHEILMKALKTLPNLRRINVSVTWLKIPLDLESLTSLQEITMQEISKTLQEEIFEGLAKTVAHNPRLTLLEIRNYGLHHRDIDKFQSLHQVFKYYPTNAPPLRLRDLQMHRCRFRLDHITMPHLRHLTSLDLMGVEELNTPARQSDNNSGTNSPSVLQEEDSFGSSLEDVWIAFRLAGVQLENIDIDMVPNSFLDYLSSYSGLKKLYIELNKLRDLQLSDSLACRFFKESLRNHTHSLEELVLSTSYEGLWCIGSHNLELLGQCKNMERICMSVNCSQLPLPLVTDDDQQKAPLSESDPNLITTLLDTAVTRMPNIKFVRILEAAIMNCCSARPCGVHSMQQPSSRVTSARILSSFTPPASCRSLPFLTMNSLLGRRVAFVGRSMENSDSKGSLRYVPAD